MEVARTWGGGRGRPPRIDGWSVGAAAIAVAAAAPILGVAWTALTPTENIWPHLIRTVLPDQVRNTFVLMAGVGALSAAIGAGAAWLVSMYRFPASRALEWALLTPLAIPAYVGAYALVDFLEYAGPVQTALRGLMGWRGADDYPFPEIRSLWAAILVQSLSLYPYVYLLARAALRERSGCAFEVARTLGAGPVSLFARVGLPLSRPAVAAGAAIVMMETVNDFGVADYFAVRTLTTAIFSVWLESYNAGGAAQIACALLAVVFALVALERVSRRNSRYFRLSRQARPVERQTIPGARGWGATVCCLLPVLAGFVLPVGVISGHAFGNFDLWRDPELIDALTNTLKVGAAAAFLTVAAALFLVFAVRLSGRAAPRLLLPAAMIGYAVPGAVLAVGILIPLAALDHRLADLVLAVVGIDPGLVLTGTAAAIVMAYSVRFFAIAVGAADGALGRISPSLPMASRSLGRTRGRTLAEVQMPLMWTSVGTALLLVFVDCVKELPATLLLRPFDFDTLATRTYESASLENLGGAAPAALLVMAVGLTAVAVLARASR